MNSMLVVIVPESVQLPLEVNPVPIERSIEVLTANISKVIKYSNMRAD